MAPERRLTVTHPRLVAELHPTRNGDLTAAKLSSGLKDKVWWQCTRGHEWEAAVRSRAAGTGCPVCAHTTVAPERSLAQRNPDLLAEVHPWRNPGLDPAALAAGSSRKLWWQCRDGHEWEARVHTRTRGSGCPICARRHVDPERTLAQVQPGLAQELHPSRNPGLNATTLAAGSNGRVWWQCPRGHEWQARPRDRVAGTGCPTCVRSAVAPERTLAQRHPGIAAQLHPSRNPGVEAGELAAQSNRKVWWQCPRGHEWEARVYVRARGSGCPICAREHVARERTLAHKLPALAKELHPSRNAGLDANTLAAGSSRKVWWQCRHGHEWEARVSARVAGTGCPRCAQLTRAATRR